MLRERGYPGSNDGKESTVRRCGLIMVYNNARRVNIIESDYQDFNLNKM